MKSFVLFPENRTKIIQGCCIVFETQFTKVPRNNLFAGGYILEGGDRVATIIVKGNPTEFSDFLLSFHISRFDGAVHRLF